MTSKATYTKPVVTKFGSVASLTQGVGGSNADTGQAAVSKRGNG